MSVPEDFTDNLVDRYCVVEYDGLPYPGKILDVDDDMVEVSAMHRIGVNRFFWPMLADELCYTKEKILTFLDNEPEKVTARHRQLPKGIWEEIMNKLDLENQK